MFKFPSKNVKEHCETLSKELQDVITTNSHDSNRSLYNTSSNNRSFSSNLNKLQDTNDNKRKSIQSLTELPPLLSTKNAVKAPGLSYRQPNIQNASSLHKPIIYPTKTVKRTSSECNKTYPLINSDSKTAENSNNDNSKSNHDESFSTQDLRDISNNELLMNSAAKRTKL